MPMTDSSSTKGSGMFDALLHDLSFGWRQLRRSPGFSAIAILTLALGIGANTAIFTLVNTIMLTRLPVGHPQQLVLLHWMSHSKGPFVWNHMSGYGGCDMRDPGSGNNNCSFSYPVLEDLREHAKSFQGLAALAGGFGAQLDMNGHASVAGGLYVNGDFFPVLEVRAAYGRTLVPSDDRPGAAPVVMLGFNYWQQQFNSDPNVVGSAINLNGVPFTIVGIAPPEFFGISPGSRPNLWAPMHDKDVLEKTDPTRYEARSIWLYVIGRLKDGVTPERARAETEVLFRGDLASAAATIKPAAEGERSEKKAIDTDLGIAITSAARGMASLRNAHSTQLYLLMGVTGLVLLIACANIANLLLARASARRKEIAVRLALGASRGRLLRQMLTESLLLAAIGCVAGLVIAYWASRGIVLILFGRATGPILAMFHPSLTVFGFTAGVAVVAAVLFGLVPSLTSTRVSPGATLKAAGGSSSDAERRNRLGRALVAGEMALALVLVIGAGLFLRTLLQLETLDPGLRVNHLLSVYVGTTEARIPEARVPALTQELNRRIAALPGVEAVSWTSDLLLVGDLWTTDAKLQERPELADVEAQALSIGPKFFETVQIPILAGRSIEEADCRKDATVIWVNKAYVDRFLKGASPLGLHIVREKKLLEIVGVAGDTKFQSLRDEFKPAIFFPAVGGDGYFLVRTAGNPRALEDTVRNVFSETAPNLPIIKMRPLRDDIDNDLSSENAMARLSVTFGLLALVLAAIGIYGVLAYSVARRTSEIAIRMSLGAMPGNIQRLILLDGLRPAVIGALAGLLGSWGLTRLVANLLYGVKPLDVCDILRSDVCAAAGGGRWRATSRRGARCAWLR